MKKLKKYKTFENLQNVINEQVDVDKNDKIKEILGNIIKTKRYVAMLKDTTDRVFELVEEQFPQGARSFIENIEEIDDFLGNLVNDLYDIISTDIDSVSDTIEMLLNTISNIEEYTSAGNIDFILSQQDNSKPNEMHPARPKTNRDIMEEEEEEEEEEDGSEVENDQSQSNIPPKENNDDKDEDQLTRRKK